MVAMNTTITGGGGDTIHAYIAKPDGAGPYPGVVLLHHAPGWDEYYREFTRRFAEHGFIAVAPNLYERYGHGTPEEVTAKVRADGGVSDDSVVADAEAALNWITSQPNSNGKVGVIGNCSGGRHALLAASRVPAFNAVADLWGGGVIASPDRINPRRCSKSTARCTSSTATTGPGTPSWATTGRAIVRSRRWTPGARSWTGSPRTWRSVRRQAADNCVLPVRLSS